ncbi:hypothetical protein ABIE59_004056 [Marinobacter sp. MBR-99]|jgi:hypothetical protein|uniref:hypothetical protein n=1 Tax=Marinobacter sp. MBR-99 TaxID=3156461 RepID=UPI003390B84A
MSLLEQLESFKKKRAEPAPFSSLLEFEEWSDAVLPLLSFDEVFKREFSQAVTAAGVTHRLGNHVDSNTNMNRAIGVLNQAINQAKKFEGNGEKYVSEIRIAQIRKLVGRFDYSKLVILLEELNSAYENKMYYSVGCLIRAVIDHIPPVFGCKNFSEVANNYSGTKSFKEAMRALNDQMRKVTDSYLHTQIREKEVAPVEQQVEARSSLDILLSEIVRVS